MTKTITLQPGERMMRLKGHILAWISGAVVVIVVYFMFLNDVLESLTWHLAHGKTVSYSGRQLTLPLLWRQDYSKDSVIKLSRAAFFHPYINAGLSGPEFLAIGSDPFRSAKLDDALAARWQSDMVARFQGQNLFAKPETIKSKATTFYCFNRDDASTHGGSLNCKASGTNWEVIFGVGDGGAGPVEGQLDEARTILRSMQ